MNKDLGETEKKFYKHNVKGVWSEGPVVCSESLYCSESLFVESEEK